MRPRFLALLIGLVACHAYGADERWIPVTGSDDLRTFYIDRQSIKLKDSWVEYWEIEFFHVLIPKDEASGRPIKEKRILRRVNCSTRQQQFLQGVLLDENRRLIESTFQRPEAANDMPIAPHSTAETELKMVCDIALKNP